MGLQNSCCVKLRKTDKYYQNVAEIGDNYSV